MNDAIKRLKWGECIYSEFCILFCKLKCVERILRCSGDPSVIQKGNFSATSVQEALTIYKIRLNFDKKILGEKST